MPKLISLRSTIFRSAFVSFACVLTLGRYELNHDSSGPYGYEGSVVLKSISLKTPSTASIRSIYIQPYFVILLSASHDVRRNTYN